MVIYINTHIINADPGLQLMDINCEGMALYVREANGTHNSEVGMK